ncbi:MAG: transposase [Mariprofundaceae bacterium]|nr:transposase [Mariprofundaceae bacterium]
MFDMLQVLSSLRNELKSKNYRRFSLIVVAVLSMVGRVTMLGISRWTDKGGSYRTVERFLNDDSISLGYLKLYHKRTIVTRP